MNEHGLSINEHALDLAVFQQPSGSMPSLCKADLGSWALGLHVTVAEVAAALAAVRVVGSPGGQWGLHDATGQSIVVEYVKGELRVHNNTVHEDNSGTLFPPLCLASVRPRRPNSVPRGPGGRRPRHLRPLTRLHGSFLGIGHCIHLSYPPPTPHC